jgi:hypothetical protein
VTRKSKEKSFKDNLAFFATKTAPFFVNELMLAHHELAPP